MLARNKGIHVQGRIACPRVSFSRLCVLFSLVVSCTPSRFVPGEDSPFIGWKGETYRPEVMWNTSRIINGSSMADASKKPWIEVISWSPRAFVYHNLLSPEECDHIIKLATLNVKRSTVIGNGTPTVHNVRTSYGTFLERLTDPVVTNVSARVAHWVGVPAINQESMQVLRYGESQKYGPHYDVLDHEAEQSANPRLATVLLYLTDVEQGGETTFPQAYDWADPSMQVKRGPWSKCADGQVSVKPRKGDALLFFSMWPNGRVDKKSEHMGCPVQEGVKWAGTLWVHSKAFRKDEYFPRPHTLRDAGHCQDYDSRCPDWAKRGGCESNAIFMVNDPNQGGRLGECRLSCKACTVCTPSDKECYLKNREKAGYLSISEVWDWVQETQ